MKRTDAKEPEWRHIEENHKPVRGLNTIKLHECRIGYGVKPGSIVRMVIKRSAYGWRYAVLVKCKRQNEIPLGIFEGFDEDKKV